MHMWHMICSQDAQVNISQYIGVFRMGVMVKGGQNALYYATPIDILQQFESAKPTLLPQVV